MYTANKKGDSTPPCLTPFVMLKVSEKTPAHKTRPNWEQYESHSEIKTRPTAADNVCLTVDDT